MPDPKVSPNVGWSAPSLRALIGRELLKADRPRTAKELEGPLQSHQSNIKKEADRMASLGLISAANDPPRERMGGGRPPKTAYFLGPDQRAAASRELTPLPLLSSSAGRLRRGQEIVVAQADREHIADLMHVLAEAQSVAQAAWVAVCGQELFVVFDGPDPVDPAMDLLAVLDAARIPGHRSTVARIRPASELINHAIGTVSAARRARIKRDTRHAS